MAIHILQLLFLILVHLALYMVSISQAAHYQLKLVAGYSKGLEFESKDIMGDSVKGLLEVYKDHSYC